jgi:hypothetical protein
MKVTWLTKANGRLQAILFRNDGTQSEHSRLGARLTALCEFRTAQQARRMVS